MKFLIDTQILIWFQLNNKKLSKKTMSLLINTSNEIFIGQITLFEIAIK